MENKMAYQWDSTLETGYEKVDNQHKQLVLTLNKLIDASVAGKDDEEIFKVLDFLTGYTIMHFRTEEELMTKFEYPDFYVHKQYHDDFKVTVGDFNQRIIDEGPSKGLVHVVTSAIGDWLVNHIKGDDFRMASYIKSKDVN
jgi:hemerythrin